MRNEEIVDRLNVVETMINRGLLSQALTTLDDLESSIGESPPPNIVDFYRARAIFVSGDHDAALAICERVINGLSPLNVTRANSHAALQLLRFIAEVSLHARSQRVLKSVLRICDDTTIEDDPLFRQFHGHVCLSLGSLSLELQQFAYARAILHKAVTLLNGDAESRTLWGGALATLATLEREVGNPSIASEHVLLASRYLEEIGSPSRGCLLAELAALETAGSLSIAHAVTLERASFVDLVDAEARNTGDRSLAALSRLYKHKRALVGKDERLARIFLSEALEVARSKTPDPLASGVVPAIFEAAAADAGSRGDLEQCRQLAQEGLAASIGNNRRYHSRFLVLIAAVDRLLGFDAAAIDALIRASKDVATNADLDNLAPEEVSSYLHPHVEILKNLLETQFSFGDIANCWATLEQWSAAVTVLTTTRSQFGSNPGAASDAAVMAILVQSALAVLRISESTPRDEGVREHSGALYELFRKRWIERRSTVQHAALFARREEENRPRDGATAVCHLFAIQNTCGAVISCGKRLISVKFALSPDKLRELSFDIYEDIRQVGIAAEGLLSLAFKELWNPIRKVLDTDTTKIVMVPHGEFFFIPFQALSYKDKTGRQVLVSDHISISYSVGKVGVAERPLWRSQHHRLTALLILSSQDVPDMARERAVLEMLPWGLTILKGPSVEQIARTLVSSKFDVVHFVAHGFVEFAFPELSRIMLAEDSPLTVYEIASLLNFDGALVTLSACESAMRRYDRGDFGNSLLHACFQAGASNVLASSWPLGGVFGTVFVEEFYRCLIVDRDLSKAYRAGQARAFALSGTVQPNYHPTYWGPMSLWSGVA